MDTIAIEASNLARPDQSGVAVYGTNLIRSLAALDRENQYVLCYRLSRIRKRRHFPVVEDKRFRRKMILEPFNRRFMRRVDLYHGLDARVYGSGRAKKVVTIHDVLHYADVFPVSPSPEHRVRRFRRMLADVDRIIAVSTYTKKELVRAFHVREEKIDVIHHGVAERFRPVGRAHVRSALKRYGIREPYLLYVGCIEKRKNLCRLLKAFSLLDPGRPDGVQLILAGNPGEGAESIYRSVSALDLQQKVRFVGYVQEEDLPLLYAGAILFLFPSSYEGFGLPVLEAMACGTPVVASDATAMPEVAGDAAVLVDPNCEASIASAVRTLLADASLQETYRERGLERVRAFTWEETARKTLRVYQELLHGKDGVGQNVNGPVP